MLTLPPDTTVKDAVDRINQTQTEFALIVAPHLIGLFTEHNLFQAVASEQELATLPVSAVMTPTPITLNLSEIENHALVLRQFQQHQLQYLPVVNDQGHPVSVISFHTVLEWLQNDASSRSEHPIGEDQFGTLATNIPGAIYRCTPASGWQIAFVNEALEAITGYPASDFLINGPRRFIDIVYPEDLARVEQVVAEALQHRRSFRLEYRIIHVDGSLRWLDERGQGVFDQQGEVLWLDGVLFDITDRKRMEQALQESTKRFDEIAQTISQFFFIRSAAGKYLYVSPAYERIWGRTCASLYQDPNSWLEAMHPDDRLAILHSLEQQWQSDSVSREYRIVRPDGTLRWIKADVSLIRDAEGNPLRCVGLAEDITDRKQAEQQIRFQAELLDTVEQAAIAIDLTGRITYWNRYAETLYGWTKAEAIGQNINLILPETSQEQVSQMLLQLRANSSWTGELEVQRKNRTTFIAMVVSSPIHDEQGNLTGIVGISSDVTKRKQMEAALRQSEQRYRAIVEDQTEFIARYRADTIITFANEAFCRYFGLTKEEIVGRSYQNVIFSDDRDHVAQLISTLSVDNPVVTVENRVVATNETVRWTQWINRVILNDKNQIVEFQTVGRDITDLKQIEMALRESEEKFRQLASRIQDVFWVLSPTDFSSLYISPAFETIWGQSCEAVYHNSYLFFDTIHPDDRERIWNAVSERNQLGGESDLEYRIIKPDGEVRWIRDRGFPIHNESGQIYRFVGVASDITDRKQAETALQQAKEAAESANQAKSEFLSRMSHELRTPLTSVLGFVDLIAKDTALSAEHQENLTIIRRNGTYLLNLINSVLEMSKIEAGELTLNETSFDLYRLLENIKQLFQLKAASKGLELCFTWNSDLPQYIQADENKLRQVLLNLLDNAIKYTETGRIALRVSQEQTSREETADKEQSVAENQAAATNSPSSHSPVFLRFQVEDTGMGIADEELSILFDAFVQTEAGRKLQQGTGLGLTISRQFVQMMGGEITVKSQLGQGTILTFVIPVKICETRLSSSSAAVQRSVISVTPSAPYRILVVDDQAETRKILVKILEPIGFEVREATNGREAIDLWQQWQPHLIWMDMQMPVMNGYTTTQQIRAEERASISPVVTKIIALTASAFDQQRSSALAAGCDDFVVKPFQQANILEKMAEHLELQYQWAEPSLNDEAPSPTAPTVLSSFSPALLQTLPTTWSADLRYAALRLSSSQCLKLIEQLPETHTLLAQRLTELVNQFQFDAIVEWIEHDRGDQT